MSTILLVDTLMITMLLARITAIAVASCCHYRDLVAKRFFETFLHHPTTSTHGPKLWFTSSIELLTSWKEWARGKYCKSCVIAQRIGRNVGQS